MLYVHSYTPVYNVPYRFTELYVNELSSNEDLTVLVHSYLTSVQVSDEIVQGIIRCELIAVY